MLFAVVKVVHIVAVVAWFAALFYIFRLFVYHRQKSTQPALCQTFEVMEEKLLRIIGFPAALTTVLSGMALLHLAPEFMLQTWLWLKLLFVLFLLAYHFLAVHTRQRFLQKDFFLSEKSCRLINEVPTLCLIVIVALVEIKPWL